MFKFNTDLLLTREDREVAQKAYPNFFFALDLPELRTFFTQYDTAANNAKRGSRRSGIKAILLGLTGWLIAVAEPAYAGAGLGKNLLLATSAILGILSVVIGVGGILYSSSKQRWLLNRFVTERTRQFFFQNVLFNIEQLLHIAKNVEEEGRFTTESLARFETFKQRLTSQLPSEFDRVVKGGEDSSYWILPPPATPIRTADPQAYTELFSIFQDLRIEHQLNFAWHKLREPHALFDFPARQVDRLFSGVSLIAIGILFALNFVQLAATIAGFQLMPEPWSYIVTIWIALIPLAIRTLEEGLQPQREVERYENYKNVCRLKRDEFQATVNPEEKYLLLVEIERASTEEMRLFLKTHLAARFVM